MGILRLVTSLTLSSSLALSAFGAASQNVQTDENGVLTDAAFYDNNPPPLDVAGLKTDLGITQPLDTEGAIEVLADRTISLCRFMFSGSTYVPSGTFAYSPDPANNANLCFTRDFAMMVRGFPDKFSSGEIHSVIEILATAQGGSGQIGTWITGNQTVQPAASAIDPADNQFEWIDLIYSHYRKTGSPSAYVEFETEITAALGYPTIQDNLVYITQNMTTESQQREWGFQDMLASSGYTLMGSVMRYRAYVQLSELATAAGDSGASTTYAAEAALIKAALETHLWDSARGLFWNASIDNHVHSIPGSAYAVVVGACSNTVADAISSALVDMMAGGPDAAEAAYQQGYVRHIPSSEAWDRFRAVVGTDTYQNGGYWSVFTGWVAAAMARTDTAAADQLLADFIDSTPGTTEERPYESINVNIAYLGNRNYGPAAAGPNSYYVETVYPHRMVSRFSGGLSSPTFAPAVIAQSEEDTANLILQGKGNGRVVTGGPLWTMATASSSRSTLALNNNTSDPPDLAWYTANNTNFAMDADSTGLRMIVNASESGAGVIGQITRTGYFAPFAGLTIYSPSTNADLPIIAKGIGSIRIGAGGYTSTTATSGANSLVLNNGTTDSPNVKFATGNLTNISIGAFNGLLRGVRNKDESGAAAIFAFSNTGSLRLGDATAPTERLEVPGNILTTGVIKAGSTPTTITTAAGLVIGGVVDIEGTTNETTIARDDTFLIRDTSATANREAALSDILTGAAASETVIGTMEFATDAETATLTSSSLSAHPSGVSSALGPDGVIGHRLTLTSGTPVTTADVTAATTVYLAPYIHNRVALYNGATWKIFSTTELSEAVPATADTNYDVYLYSNAGTPDIELTAWTNDTTRATALTRQDGILVKTGDATRRYIGSFRTTGVSGQTEDSEVNRLVWNYTNRKRRPLRVVDATNSWAYSTNTFRAWNNSTANRVSFVRGLAEDAVTLTFHCLANNASSASYGCGIGLDSVTVPSSVVGLSGATLVGTTAMAPVYQDVPSEGYHYLQLLEIGGTSGTTTWYGDNAGAVTGQSGGSGFIDG